MNLITLSKIAGERYDARAFKSYNITRAGQVVGTLEQSPRRWEVRNLNLEVVSAHSTIRAAARVAKGVL